MIKEAISKIVDGSDLSMAEAEGVMTEIMQGQTTPAQIGAFLIALRMKGETVDEIAGCATAMRQSAIPVRPKKKVLIDTCGTGGDATGTFNISTTVAFVLAGAGVAVAKHGNRSVSSRCGSADLIQALGVNMNLTADQVALCIDEVGIGFLFAQSLHPAMKNAAGPRRELGMRTIFNILGPLSNPALAKRQLLGVYSPEIVETVAQVLRTLGSDIALVVHGADGLDELSTTGANKVAVLRQGRIETNLFDPHEFGIPRAKLSDLAGGTADDNAAITRAILKGEKGPKRDIVVLNAASGLVAAGKTRNFHDGILIACNAIDSGAAQRKLDRLVEFSNSLK